MTTDTQAAVAAALMQAANEIAGEVAAHGLSELAPFLRRRILAITPAAVLAAVDST